MEVLQIGSASEQIAKQTKRVQERVATFTTKLHVMKG